MTADTINRRMLLTSVAPVAMAQAPMRTLDSTCGARSKEISAGYRRVMGDHV